MILKACTIALASLLILACNTQEDLEESLILYDSQKSAQLAELLTARNVNFRIQPDGQIYYPVSQKRIVLSALEQVTGRKIPDLIPQE